MTIEGELTVRLGWDGRAVRRVAIHSSRPFAIARVLSGRAPADARAMVPRLFAICGGAQGAAAAAALAAASAHSHERDEPGAAELTAVVEAAQEHFWRLLIDWPRAMGRPPATTPVAAARREIGPVLAELMARVAEGGTGAVAPRTIAELAHALDGLSDAVYAMPPDAWLALDDPAALAAWAERGATLPAALLRELFAEAPDLGRCSTPLMPVATRELLVDEVMPALARDPEFCRAPLWRGRPVETGPLARQRAHPLVAALAERDGHVVTTRMVARLVELAVLLERLRNAFRSPPAPRAVRGHALADGEGLAAVETARGLLLHRVRLADETVADYAIVAPTEWNFHPSGALAEGLAQLAADDEAALVRKVRIAVQALDPCVACRVEVGHA